MECPLCGSALAEHKFSVSHAPHKFVARLAGNSWRLRPSPVFECGTRVAQTPLSDGAAFESREVMTLIPIATP